MMHRPPSRRLALVLALVLAPLAPRAARAQSDCAAGTLASYLALGATGCRVAGIHVHDFALVSDTWSLDPALVRLAPRVEAAPGGAWLGFLVTAPFGPRTLTGAEGFNSADTRFGFAMEGTTVAGARTQLIGASASGSEDFTGQSIAVALVYGSSGRPTSFDYFSRRLIGVVGTVVTDTQACLGGTAFPGGSASFPGGACGTTSDPLLFAPVATGGRVFELTGAVAASSSGGHLPSDPLLGAGAADLDGFVGQYLVSDVLVTAAPEPSTLALLGVGLLATAAARRRRTR